MACWVAAGCVELPREPALAGGEVDAASGFVWSLDAGWSRPPTAPPYTGPQCESIASPGLSAGSGDASAAVGRDATPAALDGGSRGLAGARAPAQPGDLLISELMPDPIVIPDSAGEWLELHNPGASALSLEGCAIDDGGSSPRAIALPLVVDAGSVVTLARSDAPGFVPDHVMSLSLANGADSVALLCGGIEIDRVSYGGGVLRAVAGASLSRGSDGVWCVANMSYGDNRGTPGELNPPCVPHDDGDAGAP